MAKVKSLTLKAEIPVSVTYYREDFETQEEWEAFILKMQIPDNALEVWFDNADEDEFDRGKEAVDRVKMDLEYGDSDE